MIPSPRTRVTLPNFLVIGAGRSGTTSLHHYLGHHPQVFVPAVKSPGYFFCCDRPAVQDATQRALTRHYFVADFDRYQALFDGVRDETAIGEVSPVYLATTRAAPRIASLLPHARLIAILRHPVDRAYARFVARVRDGLERRRDFAQVVEDERREGLIRDESFGTYIASGFCAHVLQTYFDRFPRSRIRVHLFEDFARDPAGVLSDLFAFLDVDRRVVVETATWHNRSGGVIRNPLLRFLWTRSSPLRVRLRSTLPGAVRDAAFRAFTRDLVTPVLDPRLRADLVTLFRDDIERTQRLLERDLSHWLEPRPPDAPAPGAAP
jgi:hypothetical protein